MTQALAWDMTPKPRVEDRTDPNKYIPDVQEDGVYEVEFTGIGEPRIFAGEKDGKKWEVEKTPFNFTVTSGRYEGGKLRKWVNCNADPRSEKADLHKIIKALLGNVPTSGKISIDDLKTKTCKAFVSVTLDEEGDPMRATITEFKPFTGKPNVNKPAPKKQAPKEPEPTPATDEEW
jgi:hypothetical protein